jgi:hypothetical protein
MLRHEQEVWNVLDELLHRLHAMGMLWPGLELMLKVDEGCE